jgi:hypothetical protein
MEAVHHQQTGRQLLAGKMLKHVQIQHWVSWPAGLIRSTARPRCLQA